MATCPECIMSPQHGHAEWRGTAGREPCPGTKVNANLAQSGKHAGEGPAFPSLAVA